MPVYSYSRLGTYQNCPLQYKFHYIDKVKVPELVGIEAFLGGLVHEVMEKLYKDLKLSKFNSLDDLLTYFRETWEKNWHDEIQISKKGYTQENYFQTGERCIRDYYQRYHPFNERTLGLEERIIFPLDPEGKYRIKGFIDRLVEPEDGIFEIHDYKTGATLPKQADLKDDHQLSLYQIGVECIWPSAKKVKQVWHYMQFDKELSQVLSREEIEDIRRQTIELIEEIESTENFEPNPTGLCGWCDYAGICPAKGHELKVEALPPNKYLKDDGVKLVNRLTELKARKTELSNSIKPELEEISEEIERVEEAIKAYCDREGLTRLMGSTHQAELRQAERLEMPGKNDEGRPELEEIIRQAGKWDEVSTLSNPLLREALTGRGWDKRLKNKVGKYTQIIEDTKISHRKRDDLDTD